MEEGKRLERYVRLRWGRDKGGIRGLAEACHTSADTLYHWFNGVTTPDTRDLALLAQALGVRRWEIVAAMDDAQAVALDDPGTKETLRDLLEELLAERDARRPPRTPPGRAGAA